MAEILEAFTFRTQGPIRIEPKYDYVEMFDGKIRKYVKGTDYTCSDASFRGRALQKGRDLGLLIKAQTPSGPDGKPALGSVIVQKLRELTVEEKLKSAAKKEAKAVFAAAKAKATNGTTTA